MHVYDPTGRVGSGPSVMAPSPVVLAGVKIGLLDNTKPNAGLLLSRLADRLATRTGAVVSAVETKNAALAAPDQVMGRLTKEVQVVLTGSAD